ncbi:MAG: c-type cytochrome [Acidobacteria bacterium]|nr:c-type cytochrome [Acidobacteriota bacterium]
MLRHWTALTSTLLLAAFTVVVYREARQEWYGRELKQIVNEDLGLVDRCSTCHPERTHPAPWLDQHPAEKFGCTSCHEGQGRATTAQAAHRSDPSWPRPLLANQFLGAACARCHSEEEIPFEPYLSDGRKLFLDTGCVGCHDVTSLRGLPKLGPDLRHVGSKVNASWLRAWLKRPKDYQPKTRMPNFQLSDREIVVLTSHLLSLRAPEPPPALTAPASLATEGGKLFRQSRCVSCHTLKGRGGKTAGELECFGSKAEAAWVAEYLRDPRRHFPASRMPRYRFGAPQARALAAYLTTELRCQAEPAPPPEPVSPAEAQRIIRRYGCNGCHEIPGFEKAGPVGAELDGFADKPAERLDFGNDTKLARTWQQWTLAKLKKPRQFRDTLKMPDHEFEDLEALNLAVYLRSLTSRAVPAAYRHGPAAAAYKPEGAFGRLVEELRCLDCHRIRGTGASIAPDLTFEGSRVRRAWLEEFLNNPQPMRLYMEERMPRFRLAKEEIQTIANYLGTVLVADWESSGAIPRELAARGRLLYFEKYACHACHQSGEQGGAIGPDLTGVRRRLTSEWLLHYLRDSHALAGDVPEPALRLPEDEALAVAAFLESQ